MTDQFISNQLSPLVVGGVTWTRLVQKRRQSLFFPPLSSSPLGQFAISGPAELRRDWPKRDCSQSTSCFVGWSSFCFRFPLTCLAGCSCRFNIFATSCLLFKLIELYWLQYFPVEAAETQIFYHCVTWNGGKKCVFFFVFHGLNIKHAVVFEPFLILRKYTKGPVL